MTYNRHCWNRSLYYIGGNLERISDLQVDLPASSALTLPRYGARVGHPNLAVMRESGVRNPSMPPKVKELIAELERAGLR